MLSTLQVLRRSASTAAWRSSTCLANVPKIKKKWCLVVQWSLPKPFKLMWGKNLFLSLLPLSHTFVRWYFNNPFLTYISAKRLRKESVDTQSVSCMRASHFTSLPPCSFLVFIQPSLSRESSCQNLLQYSDAQCTSTKWLSVHSFFS